MLLIPELMQLACKILPSAKSTHVQTLPSLFQVATNFEDPVLRHIATIAFRFIDTFSRTSKGVNAERYSCVTCMAAKGQNDCVRCWLTSHLLLSLLKIG